MRSRLVAGNIVTVTLVTIVLALGARGTLRSQMNAAARRDLERRTNGPGFGQGPGPRRPGGPDDHGGPQDFGGPNHDGPDDPGKPAPRNGNGNRFGQNGPPPPPIRPMAPRVFGKDNKARGNLDPWDNMALERSRAGEMVYSEVVVDDEPLLVLSRPIRHRDSEETEVVQAVYPLGEIDRAVTGLDATLLALFPIALLAAALSGAWLTGRTLLPVRQISDAAEHLTATRLDQRLPVSGNDEFAKLAKTINEMLANLELSFVEKEKLLTKLAAEVERQQRFTADASHELKTPLTTIKANTGLALTYDLDAHTREALAEIDRAANAMNQLVHDLLLLARADEGRLDVRKVAFPLAEAISGAVRRFKAAPGAKIVTDGVDPEIIIEADQDALERVIANLLQNARRHTPADGTITISCNTNGELVKLTVADTGTGVSPEQLEHMGERFFRTDSSRAREDGGVGLGLAICREIINAHSGTMTFESEAGRGLAVSIELARK